MIPDVITWPIVSAVLGVLGGAFTVYRWFASSIAAVQKSCDDRITELETSHREALQSLETTKIAVLGSRVGQIELDLARNYVTHAQLRLTEDKLATSVDKLINRFDGFAVDFNRALLKLAER